MKNKKETFHRIDWMDSMSVLEKEATILEEQIEKYKEIDEDLCSFIELKLAQLNIKKDVNKYLLTLQNIQTQIDSELLSIEAYGVKVQAELERDKKLLEK